MDIKIAFISTCTYATPPRTYGGECFWWNLCCAFSQMGHFVHLFAAAGSKCPSNGKLTYNICTYGETANRVAESNVPKLYMPEILDADYIIDASHEKLVMQEIWNFHREHAWKTINVLNGLVTGWPMCHKWNIVVGSQKWKELSLLGLSQFHETPWAKDYGAVLTPLPPGSIVAVIPWATNTEFYCPSDYSKEDYFLWFSRPTPYKGLHRAIRLAQDMGIRLVVAMPMEISEHQYFGEHYLQQINEAVAKGAKIEFVKLPGDSRHHIAKRELYRKAKALLFTIEAAEPFGLTVIESLACGTPVIASRIGAMPEIIKHGETGYLAHIDSDDGFKMAIENIEKIDPKACVEDARKRFDRSVAAVRYIELWQKLKEEHENTSG